MPTFLNALNLTVTKAGVKMSRCKDCSLSVGCDTTECAGRSQGAAQEFLPGRKSWSVRVKQLIADTSEASTTLAQMQVGSIVSVSYNIGSTIMLSGSAYVTRIKHNYECGKVASADISLTGTGSLSKV